jgi:hypothetical protein
LNWENRQFFELGKQAVFWTWKTGSSQKSENRWFFELKNWRNHCYFISRKQNPLFSCLKVGKPPPISQGRANLHHFPQAGPIPSFFSNLEFLGNLDSGFF